MKEKINRGKGRKEDVRIRKKLWMRTRKQRREEDTRIEEVEFSASRIWCVNEG